MRISRLTGVALAAPIALGLGLVAVAADRDVLLDRLANTRRLDVSAEESGWEPLGVPDPTPARSRLRSVSFRLPRHPRAGGSANRFDFILRDGTFIRAGTPFKPGHVLGLLDGFGGWRFFALTDALAARLDGLVAKSVRASTRHVLGAIAIDGHLADVVLEERAGGWTVTIALPPREDRDLEVWLLARHGSTQAGRPLASSEIFLESDWERSTGFGFVTQSKRRDLTAVVVSVAR